MDATPDPDNLAILRDEEDEPDFSAIIKRAQARADELGGDDGQLIRDLLSIIHHYDCTLDAYYWSMSDNGHLPGGV